MNIIHTKAISFLARREHCRHELFRKLLLKGFPSSAINDILDLLEHDGLLNEDRYIASFIRFRRNKGFGPLKVCAELANHGINRDRIAISDEWQEIMWQSAAISARIKQFGETIPVKTAQRIQQAKFLHQRGFTNDQIRSALKR